MKMAVQSSKSMLKNKKGLTLIELLAIVVIVGIIAAIAIPAVNSAISKSKTSADAATSKLVKEAAVRYAIEKEKTDDTTVTIADLVGTGYLSSTPDWTGTTSYNAVKIDVDATTGKIAVDLITQ